MRDKLSNLQALRGAACLGVVLFHAAELEGLFGCRFAPLRPFRYVGYAGVDLFFVISGFVMAYAHRDWFGRPARIPGFAARRAWRIYPTYWAVLGVVTVSSWLVEWRLPDPGAAGEWWRAAALLPEPGRFQNWLPQAWTLSFELAFYLAFAALLALPRRAAAAAFFGWGAGLAAVWAFGVWPADPAAQLWCSPLVAEFLGGVAVGWVVSERVGRWVLPLLAAAGLWVAAVAGIGAVGHLTVGSHADAPRVAIWGVPSVLVVAAAAGADLGGRWRAPRFLAAVGEASYSIYLIHWFTQTLVFAAWSALGFGQRSVSHTLWIGATVGAAVVGGWLLHRFVEKPLVGMMAGRKRSEVRGHETRPPGIPAAGAERRAA